MADSMHSAAVDHLPIFITAPGDTDILFNVMVVFVLLLILLVGVLYLRLHALPEHMAHGASKVQLQLVAVLSLIALFTHNHLFWIAALLLALIEFPDFSTPVRWPTRCKKSPIGTNGFSKPRRRYLPSRRQNLIRRSPSTNGHRSNRSLRRTTPYQSGGGEPCWSS
jgi:hypothetical protein